MSAPDPPGLGSPLPSPPRDGVSSLCFAQHADLLLVSSWDCSVTLYDVTLRCVRCAFATREPLLSACFVDTDAAASGGLDRTVRLHAFDSTLSEELGKHGAAVKAVAHLFRANAVASAGWDARLRLWDVRTGNNGGGNGRSPSADLALPGKAFSLAVSDTLLVVATAGRRLVAYDVRSLRVESASSSPLLPPQPPPPLCDRESPLKHQSRVVSLTPDGHGFALGSTEGRVALDNFGGASGPAPFAWKCHRSVGPDGTEAVHPVNALAWHPTTGALATGGGDGVVAIWDTTARRRIASLPPYPTSISALSFNADGTMLAVAASYGWEQGEPAATGGTEGGTTEVEGAAPGRLAPMPPSPPDAVYIRTMAPHEVTPKPR